MKQRKAARVQDSVLATRVADAVGAWDRQVEETYGAVVVELGRARAGGFFPRVGGRREKGLEPQAPGTATRMEGRPCRCGPRSLAQASGLDGSRLATGGVAQAS